MKLQHLAKTPEADITSDIIGSTTVVGLQLNDADNDIYELKQMSLSSFLADSSPDNAKNAITQLRASTANIDKKTTAISKHISEIKSINQTDLDNYDFEKLSDSPTSLKTAIDTISATYATTTSLQAMVNDVYAALWAEVTDMFTTGFQTSMYARQYTGSMQGLSEDKPVYTEIVLPDVD